MNKTQKRNSRVAMLFVALCVVLTSTIATHTHVSAAKTNTAKSYYVATNGNDSNQGTLESPFATIARAQEAAVSGDTVYIRKGTYTQFTVEKTSSIYNYVHYINKSGITYRGYKNEVPVFDFSDISTDKRVCAFYIPSNVMDVTFQSIKVTGVPVGEQKQSECFRIHGTNIKFNMVTCADNQANGFYFTGNSTGECYRCDAYNNNGVAGISIGNIDGFGAHGNGIIFRECRSFSNSDDGYDCISSQGANVFESCWAFNMKNGGDSNGFKVGGFGRSVLENEPPVHTVTNCIAANNKAFGFYANHHPGKAADWTYNTAYNNGKGNFCMLETATISNPVDIPGTREMLFFNLSYGKKGLVQADLPEENHTNNSWNISETMSDRDFESIDLGQLSAPRKADGSLPDITFMKPASDSVYQGLGVK